MITRREFVVGVTCCAACTSVAEKLAGQDVGNSGNEKLVSPCGLYCGACPMYLATQENNEERMSSRFGAKANSKQPSLENMRCDGCLGGGPTPAHVPKCAIKLCAAEKTKTGRCSECAEFPCGRISDFNNDGVQHHSEVLANLRQLRTMGITDWTKFEENRWTCSKCQTKFAWYDAECMTCKTPRSDKLFPLKNA